MLSNISNKKQIDDLKILFLIIIGIVFVAWNIICWGNQLNQLLFVWYKIQHTYSVLLGCDSSIDYKYHRNNAIIYTKMNDKLRAYEEIKIAIEKYPTHAEKSFLNDMYREKAAIEAYFGDYGAAILDYVKIKDSLSPLDKCKIGILFKHLNNRKYAVFYCTDALRDDSSFYGAWACVADIYASVGKYNVSVKLYDCFIDRAANSISARHYADRAYYKKLMGDGAGYESDMAIAYKKDPYVKDDLKIIKETLNPKVFNLMPDI